MRKLSTDEPLRCSFCHKTQEQVEKLISSPSDYPRAYICNECVGVCQQILEEEKREQASPVNRRLPRPPEIKAFLDGYVIGQDKTKKKLAVAVYNHYKRIFLNRQPGDVELTKSNILLIGPTGTGKTLLAQTLSRMLDVPFAIVDATTLTEAGLRRRRRREHHPEAAAKRRWRRHQGAAGHHLHRRDRQDLEEGRKPFHHARCFRRRRAAGAAEDSRRHHRQRASAGRPQASAPGIHARWIPPTSCSSAAELSWAWKKSWSGAWARSRWASTPTRSRPPRNRRNIELLEQAQPTDLIRYGLIPEFVGRLPVVGVLGDLDKAALMRILTEPKNALIRQYQRLFEFENVRLRFTDDALETVADLALQRKVGARGLRMILEDLMLDLMYNLPAQRKVRDFVVTAEMVRSREINWTLLEKAG